MTLVGRLSRLFCLVALGAAAIAAPSLAQAQETAPAQESAQSQETAPAEESAQSQETAPAEESAQSQETAPAEESALDVPGRSAADSLSAGESAVPREPPKGGDIRRLGIGGMDALVVAPDLRALGGGWAGHRVSFARGVLPPALTQVTLRGRGADDWVDGGLDLMAVTSPAAGVHLAPSGPDLSVWPVLTAEWPRVELGGSEWTESVILGSTPPRGTAGFEPAGHAGRIAPLTVDVRPLRRPAAPPFSRLTAASGPHGRSVLGMEFGRIYVGGSALTGFFETEDGGAPSDGGGYSAGRAGGSALVELRGGWTAELGGTRVSLDRSRPAPGPGTWPLSREYVRSDLFIRGYNGRVRTELFHTRSWLQSGPPGPEARAVADGFSAGLLRAGPFDAVRFELERRAVSGALMAATQEEVFVLAEVEDELDLGTNLLRLALGAQVMGTDVLPRASAAVMGERNRPELWRLEASLWGRHPTALERALSPRSIPGSEATGELVGGNRLLEPERAAAVSASYLRRDVLGGVGALGELVRAIGPIALADVDTLLLVPSNAADETGGALSVWAALGDTAHLSGWLDGSLFAVDPDGALNRGTPVPLMAARANASVPLRLFDGYLRTRVTAALEYETGLSRGPWAGLLDDARASLSFVFAGSAGSARFFIAIDDALSSDRARIPGMDPEGATLAAGFSWCFRD